MNKKLELTLKLLRLSALIMLIFVYYGCNNKKQVDNTEGIKAEKNEENMNLENNCLILNEISFDKKDELFNFIEKEKKEFYSYEDSREIDAFSIQYTYESAHFIFPIVSYWLQKKDYISVSDAVFNKKIKEIFNINLSKKCENIRIHKDYIEYWTSEAYETEGDLLTQGSFLFSPQYRFFFRAPAPSDLNYLQYGNFIEEIGKTKQYKSCFKENIYHYNNFLFNDSQQSLSWLIHNDKYFLSLLVREFGYDKEHKINKVTLDLTNKKYRATQPADDKVLENLFIGKTCEGKLDIRHGLFASIIENTTTQNVEYFDMLHSYISLILDNRSELRFSSSEKAEIVAYFGGVELELRNRYYEPSAQELWNLWSYTHIYTKRYPEILDEWRKHNYYNISNFSEVLEMLDGDNEPL